MKLPITVTNFSQESTHGIIARIRQLMKGDTHSSLQPTEIPIKCGPRIAMVKDIHELKQICGRGTSRQHVAEEQLLRIILRDRSASMLGIRLMGNPP